MKRLLPTISQGEVVLAAISLPPLTDDTNRHRPTASHPGKPAAASNASVIAVKRKAARLSRRADRLAAQIDGQRRERDPEFPGTCPEPAHPAPRRGMRHAGPGGRRPDPACAPGHLPDHHADRLGEVQPPGQHERGQQRMAHPARAAPHPGHEDLPAPARRPDMPPVTRPEHQRPGARRADRTGDLHLAASRHIRIDRQRARPYDGHGRLTASDPSPRSASNEARRDPSRSPKTGKSWPAQRQPGGGIVKEHGQTRGRDAQEIRPSTARPDRRCGAEDHWPIRGIAGQRSSTQLWHPTGTAAVSRRAWRNGGRGIGRRARVLSGEGGKS